MDYNLIIGRIRDTNKERINQMKKFISSSKIENWSFGKPESIISHEFPGQLGYKDIAKWLTDYDKFLAVVEHEKGNEKRYRIYILNSKFSGGAFVITKRGGNVRVITCFYMGRKSLLKVYRGALKRLK